MKRCRNQFGSLILALTLCLTFPLIVFSSLIVNPIYFCGDGKSQSSQQGKELVHFDGLWVDLWMGLIEK